MRIADASNRFIVPLGYAIQQAHQTGVWDQRADFRFVNQDRLFISKAFHASSESLVSPKMDRS